MANRQTKADPRQIEERRRQLMAELAELDDVEASQSGGQRRPARGASAPKKLMAFRQTTGGHSGPDYDVDPSPETGRRPSRFYGPGETVYSEIDLVKRCGPQKFEYLDRQGVRGGRDDSDDNKYVEGTTLPGDPSEDQMRAGSHFPHGQVSTGYQEAVSGDGPGPVRSGPLSDATREQMDEVPVGQAEPTPPDENQQTAQARGAQHPANLPAKNAAEARQSGQPPTQQRSGAKKSPPGNLDEMTVRELQEHADAEGIDLKGVRTKDEIMKAVKAHHGVK